MKVKEKLSADEIKEESRAEAGACLADREENGRQDQRQLRGEENLLPVAGAG